MKTLKWLCFLLAPCLLFFGCKRSGVVRLGNTLEDWKPASRAEPTPSDIVPFDSPADVGPSLGFELTGWPSGDALKLNHVYAVDGWFAQLEYETPDGRILVLRAAALPGKPLTTTYDESHNKSRTEESFGGTAATVATGAEGCTMATWQRGGFQYLLHSNQRFAAPGEAEIAAFVQTMDAAAIDK